MGGKGQLGNIVEKEGMGVKKEVVMKKGMGEMKGCGTSGGKEYI